MTLVVDASIAIAWCFSDETTDETEAVLDLVVAAGGVSTSFWPLEVLNSLWTAHRRKRCDEGLRHRLALFLEELPITTDRETAGRAWTGTSGLVARFGLTVYDASYLELAVRHGLPLATLDNPLRAAATAMAVPLLGKAA